MKQSNLCISLFELMDGNRVLAGVPKGEEALNRLVTSAKSADDPTVVYIDFVNIDVATASFLRESVLKFRDFCRTAKRNMYPVVANVNPDIIDELLALLEPKSDALVLCELSAGGLVSQSRVVGRLEEKQRIALNAVIKAGEAEAAKLAREYGDAEPTAWNNRLTSLNAKGILVESRKGRGKSYRTVLEL